MTTPLPECIPGRFQVDPRTIQHRRTRRPTQRRLRCARGVWTRTSRSGTGYRHHPGQRGNQGRGSFGFVALDETPAQTADLRDIAQELLDTTNINTIIVRAPGSGAIVSDQYSRKTVELAQWDLLGNPDYVSAVDNYVASVSSDSTHGGWSLSAMSGDRCSSRVHVF